MMAKYLALDKITRLINIVKHHGGIRSSLAKIYRMDDLKAGTLVGQDKYGNKYYENPEYFYGRSRWVDYAPQYGMDYDASQVPSDWYGWLHYKTDLPPHKDPKRPIYPWMADHSENLSGKPGQYQPYSTTVPKVQAWIPPTKQMTLYPDVTEESYDLIWRFMEEFTFMV